MYYVEITLKIILTIILIMLVSLLKVNLFTITNELIIINKNLETMNVSIQENTKAIKYDPNVEIRNNKEFPCL